MANWQLFEDLCVAYLNEQYGNRYTFSGTGGSDSTTSDIRGINDNGDIIIIEAKMADSQCGQFVLKEDSSINQFVFSNQNHSDEELARDIMSFMNANFEEYTAPGTSGNPLDIPNEYMYNWVINYYRSVKNVNYIITSYHDEFVIFPLNRLQEYFDITATYRVKKSGSSAPSNNNLQEIRDILNDAGLNYDNMRFPGGKLIVNIQDADDTFQLRGPNYRYQFKKEGYIYNIRRLSNTANANVIFSISLKHRQLEEDLNAFIEDVL